MPFTYEEQIKSTSELESDLRTATGEASLVILHKIADSLIFDSDKELNDQQLADALAIKKTKIVLVNKSDYNFEKAVK